MKEYYNQELVCLQEMKQQEKIVFTQAEDVNQQTYDKVPISGFGLSLMQSMGFSQQRGIGRTNKGGLQQPLVLKARPKGLGLGANPQGHVDQEDMIKIQVGQKVIITKGPHSDLTGRVIKVNLAEEYCIVQLKISEQNVKIGIRDVKQKQKHEKKQQKVQEEKQTKKKKIKWIIPGIEVKVIDKKSTLYLKKVEITQITDEYSFECRTAEGKTVTNLTEKQLQTVIPGIEEEVIVVRGNRRGIRGKLMIRDKKEHKVIIQTLEEFETLEFGEDDICKYRF